jgi:predicted  nucleic acid-binding Zn-ribbon protein
MRETLERLRTLQEVNRELAQVRRDRDRLSIDVENQERILKQKKKKIDEVHQKRLNMTKAADAAQLKIEEAEAEIERFQTQLNVVRQQKEYDALQHSILSHQADIQKWEDEALSALSAVDELSAQEEQLEQEVQQAGEELERIEQEVAEETEQCNRRIEELTREREQIRDSVEPNVLSQYDRLAASHPRDALAEVKGRICQGCYTQITKQTENLLMRGNKLVHCHSCGRLLMLAD